MLLIFFKGSLKWFRCFSCHNGIQRERNNSNSERVWVAREEHAEGLKEWKVVFIVVVVESFAVDSTTDVDK